jgi:hypothetical protein
LTLLLPEPVDLGGFASAEMETTFELVAGFAMAFPLDCPAAAYSIAHADLVDLAAKNQIGRECAAAIERLFANDGGARKVSFDLAQTLPARTEGVSLSASA